MTSSTPFLIMMMICCKSVLKSASGTDVQVSNHIEPNEVSQQAW